ncbi:hypothetical protein B0H11DRAFT_2306391 [Mycena galericulata]|nr:hypothetical protein B0H11DRAFT_2306391 [Mycena galericulata]
MFRDEAKLDREANIKAAVRGAGKPRYEYVEKSPVKRARGSTTRSFHGVNCHSAYELSSLFPHLQALPNLDCIEIHSIDSYVLNTLAKDHAFSQVKFTTVTTLSIPAFTHRMFSAFPNIQTLASPSMYSSSEALLAAKNAFPRLHSLSGVQLADHIVVEHLCGFPSLRAVAIAAPITSHSKTLLSRLMKNFCELALVESNVPEAIPLVDLIAVGTTVLQKSKGKGLKVLKIWRYDGAVDWTLSPPKSRCQPDFIKPSSDESVPTPTIRSALPPVAEKADTGSIIDEDLKQATEVDSVSILGNSEGVTQHDLAMLRHVRDKIPCVAFTVAMVEFAKRWTYYGTTVCRGSLLHSPIAPYENLYNNYIRAPLPPGSTNGAVAPANRAFGVAGALGMGQEKSFAIQTFNTFFVSVTPFIEITAAMFAGIFYWTCVPYRARCD